MLDTREALGKSVRRKIKGKEVDVMCSAVEYNGEIWTWAKAWIDLDNGVLFTPDKSRVLVEGTDYVYENNQLKFL